MFSDILHSPQPQQFIIVIAPTLEINLKIHIYTHSERMWLNIIRRKGSCEGHAAHKHASSFVAVTLKAQVC